MLPALANLFAYRHADPKELDRMERALREASDFQRVWRPAPQWVAGFAPLPKCPPTPRCLQESGLVFAEGAEVVTAAADPGRQVDRVAELAASRPEDLARLAGDFTFIHFQKNSDVTLVRSCAGLVPLYTRLAGESLAVGTLLTYFARLHPEAPLLDPLVNAAWTTGHGFFPYGRTFLKGVSALEAGHFIQVQGKRLRQGAYWNPVPKSIPRPTQSERNDRAERLRVLLCEKLDRDLDPEGGNLLSLSGGVDSSSLAALAGALGRGLSSVSLVPESGPASEKEMSYINPLAAVYGFERMWLESPGGPDWLIRLMERQQGVVFHVLHPVLLWLPAIMSEAKVSVLFGGEFADDTCGSRLTYPDWAAATSPQRLLAAVLTGALPAGPRDLAVWTKHRFLNLAGRLAAAVSPELPEWINVEIKQEYGHWLADRRKTAAAEKSPRRTLALRIKADECPSMNWEVASPLGVRRSFPFLTRDVLELSFSAHPDELIGPGTKKILKLALHGQVPARNLNRADKGQWGKKPNRPIEWNGELPAELAGIVQPQWMPAPPGRISSTEARGLAQLCQISRALESVRRSAPVK